MREIGGVAIIGTEATNNKTEGGGARDVAKETGSRSSMVASREQMGNKAATAKLAGGWGAILGTREFLAPKWQLTAAVHQIERGAPGALGGGLRVLGGPNRCRRATLRDTGDEGAGRLIARQVKNR